MKNLYLSLIFIIINYGGFAQNYSINGKITDEDGNGLPGATIIIKGTTTGTISDINGDFSLFAFEDTTLIISFSGYKRQEINVNGKTTIDIQLIPDIETLKEVVVVGYGSQEKINITGSDKELVSKVASEIKRLKPVEPYKAKGIKEKDQYVLRKEGKKK